MTHVALQTALSRLAPEVDGVPDWDDVARRAGVRPRIGWKLVAAVALDLSESRWTRSLRREGDGPARHDGVLEFDDACNG